MVTESAQNEQVDAALAEVYPNDVPHVVPSDTAGVSVVAYWREDPSPHWHLITRGLTDPQLTVRLASPQTPQPPAFILGAMTQLRRSLNSVGMPAAGNVLSMGPLLAGFSAHLRGLWFVTDPELSLTPDASDFLQIVGVTADEMRAITGGHSLMVGGELLKRSALYLTELDRQSVVSFPDD